MSFDEQEKTFLQQMYDREQIFRNKTALLAKELAERTVALEKITPSEKEIYQLVEKAPKEKQEYVMSKFKEHFKQLGYLKRLNEGYVKLEMQIGNVAEYMKEAYKPDAVQQFLRSNPGYGNKIKKPEDLKKLYMNLIKAASSYANVWKKAVENITKTDYEINKIVHTHKYSMETKAEKMVGMGLTIAFAAPVLYFLSQVSPENITVGAFFAGSGSPTLLAMFTGVVIFLLFFLTHHKLK